jgi:uncharacterized YccA/Bax inhibitor family protein
MMRSGNPALTAKTFEGFARTDSSMTVSGTVNKAFLMLLILMAGAAYTWNQFFTTGEINPGWVWGASLGAFAVAIVIIFKKQWSGTLAPVYAALEGLALGAISASFELRYPGVVVQAVGLTFGTLFCLLAAYRSGLIRATENFKLGVVAATGAIALFYLVSMGLSFFSIQVPLINSLGIWGILFSLGVTVVAALNLVLDFDFIEEGERNGAPKYMEWYGAFGLMVTLVWLYLEILRLLSKLRSRD